MLLLTKMPRAFVSHENSSPSAMPYLVIGDKPVVSVKPVRASAHELTVA